MSEVNSKNNTNRNCWYSFPLLPTSRWTTIVTVWIVELKLEHITGAEWKPRKSLGIWRGKEDGARSLESILELEEVIGSIVKNSNQNWNHRWILDFESELAEIAWTGEAISIEELGLYPGFILGLSFVSVVELQPGWNLEPKIELVLPKSTLETLSELT